MPVQFVRRASQKLANAAIVPNISCMVAGIRRGISYGNRASSSETRPIARMSTTGALADSPMPA